MTYLRMLFLFLCSTVLLNGCGGGENEGASNGIPGSSASYIVVAWNDLGMHCLNPSYDSAVILPPYNTVWAQVIKRANPPQVVTSGLTVSYRILNNTTSQKFLVGFFDFRQFWANAQKLFGVTPALDKGLNLETGGPSNGLSGTMVVKGDHFQVNGIPVVPYEDGSTVRKPYQVAEITVTDANNKEVAKTRVTVPTSDEINCGKCHGSTSTSVFDDILIKHDVKHSTSLMTQKPVLCASCHGSPALGAPLQPGKPYLSFAIHNSHASRGAGCYDCHPGATTKCNRSAKHMEPYVTGECANTNCHGSMVTVASSITAGRVPWVDEPKCASCHPGVAEVDTETLQVPQKLYRNAIGHGRVYCAGCHGSPHAMYPVDTTMDKTGNAQPLQYQLKEMVLGDCRNCHGSSRGKGGNFASSEAHGGGRSSACNVCHTGFQKASDTASWPHKFQWKDRR